MSPLRILLLKIILFIIPATLTQTPADTSLHQTKILSEVINLFYENEARGLLHYYEKSPVPEILPAVFSEASSIISTQITEKNRSKMLLHVMRVLNMFHEHEKTIRFSILQGLEIEQIYYMIWRWRNAIYTSSYNGSLDRIMELLTGLETETDFFKILKNREFEGLGIFLEAASSYNRLGDLMNFFNPTQQVEIADFLLKLICREKSLDYTITMTELLLLSHNEKLLQYTSQKIMDAALLKLLPCLSDSKKPKNSIPENEAEKENSPEDKINEITEKKPENEEVIKTAEKTNEPENSVQSLEPAKETTSTETEPENNDKNLTEINNEDKNSSGEMEADTTALHFFKLIIGAYSHFFPHFTDKENIQVDIDRSSESEEIPAWLLSEDEIERFQRLTESETAAPVTTVTTDSEKTGKIETETAELMAAKKELRLFTDSFILDNNDYRMPETTILNSAHLFNEQKVHLQRHYFFGDTDGMVTFMVFQRIFANDPDWNLEEYPTYLKIYRKNPITGLQVIMLANKPRLRLKAEKPIQEELNKYGGGFHAFIFRGHSYNMHRVINDITPMTKIAFLGSCGGFENLDTILHLSKEAHIVYSKGTGTIWVNNTFLRELGNRLIIEPDINWPELKKITRESVARELARRDIKDKILAIFDKFYIFPHENTGAIMIRKNMQMEADFPDIFDYINKITEPPGWLIIRPD